MVFADKGVRFHVHLARCVICCDALPLCRFLKCEHTVVERTSTVVTAPIFPDRTIRAQETELIDAGLQVDSCAVGSAKSQHEIQSPQRGCERIAHTLFAASKTRIGFADAIWHLASLACFLHLGEDGRQLRIRLEQVVNGTSWAIRWAFGIVMVSEKLDPGFFCRGKACDPVRSVCDIRSGKGGIWQLRLNRASKLHVLLVPLCIAPPRIAVLGVREKIGLVANLKSEQQISYCRCDGLCFGSCLLGGSAAEIQSPDKTPAQGPKKFAKLANATLIEHRGPGRCCRLSVRRPVGEVRHVSADADHAAGTERSSVLDVGCVLRAQEAAPGHSRSLKSKTRQLSRHNPQDATRIKMYG